MVPEDQPRSERVAAVACMVETNSEAMRVSSMPPTKRATSVELLHGSLELSSVPSIFELLGKLLDLDMGGALGALSAVLEPIKFPEPLTASPLSWHREVVPCS